MALLLFVGTIGFVAFRLDRFFTIDAFNSDLAAISHYRDAHTMALAGLFFLAYVAVAALALPIDLILTVAAGALFGAVPGGLLASFAASSGALVAFLVTRFLFRDAALRRFGRCFASIDRSVNEEGTLYLFALRLVPVFPFALVNIAMGLTALPARRFYIVTQLAMLPGTIAYANAGTQLAAVTSLFDVLSPPLMLSFALIGVLPLCGKKLVDWIGSGRS